MSSSDKESNNVTSFDSDATYCSEYESRIQFNNQIEQTTTRKMRNHLPLAKPLKRLKSKKSNKCSKKFSKTIPSMLQRVDKRIKAHFNGSHLMSCSEILELLGGLHKMNFHDVFQDYKNNLINRLDKLYKINRTFEEMESLKINDPMENISIPEVMQYESAGHVNAEMFKIPDNVTDNSVETVDLQFLTNQDFESGLDNQSNSKNFVSNNATGQSNEDNATGFRNSEKVNGEKTDTDLDMFSRSENQHISDSHDSDNDSAPPKKKIFKIDAESDESNGYSVKNASPESNELAKKIFKLDGQSEGSNEYPVKNASPESNKLAKKIFKLDGESEGSNEYPVKNASLECNEISKIFEQILHIDIQYSKNVDSADNVKNEDELAKKIFKLDGESEGSNGYPVKNASPESNEHAKKIFKLDEESEGSNGYPVQNASLESNELAKKIFKLDGESEGSNGYPVKNASPESIELAKIFEQILHIDRQYSKNVDSVDNVKNEDETAAEKNPFEEVEAVNNSFIKTHNRIMDKLCSDITTGKSNWEQTYDVFNDITDIFSEGNELLSKIWSNLKDTSVTEQFNIEEIVKYHVETFGPECADDIRDLLNSNLKRMEEIAEEFKNDPQVRELFDAQEKTNPEDFGLVDWRKIAQML